MHRFRVPYTIAAPAALTGASNFFKLAVATDIALFGAESGAALATAVGVLVEEVPVMLSVCRICNLTIHWFMCNPARSQMAKGYLQRLAGDRHDVCSAARNQST